MQGGLDPEYVLDKMQMYEITTLFDNMTNRDDWEQARLIAYVVAQVNSKKKLKPKDIMEFPWEKHRTNGDTSISNDDIKRLRELSKKEWHKTNKQLM